MTPEQVIGFLLALAVMSMGIAGSILPGIPGTPLVLAAAIAHRVYFGEAMSVGNWAMASLVGLTLLSILVDYLATVFGAKRMGATNRGVIGAMLGVLLGMFLSLPGILIGPFLGAVAFEMAGNRPFNEAARAGVGATLGLLAGAFGKIACCVLMIVVFTLNVLLRSMS